MFSWCFVLTNTRGHSRFWRLWTPWSKGVKRIYRRQTRHEEHVVLEVVVKDCDHSFEIICCDDLWLLIQSSSFFFCSYYIHSFKSTFFIFHRQPFEMTRKNVLTSCDFPKTFPSFWTRLHRQRTTTMMMMTTTATPLKRFICCGSFAQANNTTRMVLLYDQTLNLLSIQSTNTRWCQFGLKQK